MDSQEIEEEMEKEEIKEEEDNKERVLIVSFDTGVTRTYDFAYFE